MLSDAPSVFRSRLRHFIDVPQSLESCWALFYEVGGWPRWFPRLISARPLSEKDPEQTRGGGAAGEPTPGTRFELRFGVGGRSVAVSAEILECRPFERLRFSGRGYGLHVDHQLSVEPCVLGTRMIMAERVSGFGASLLTTTLRRQIDAELTRAMEKLGRLALARAL